MIPDVLKTPFGGDGWEDFAAFLKQHERIIMYHGTSSTYLEAILQSGLLPRELHGNNTYEGMVSPEGKSYESLAGNVYFIHGDCIHFAAARAAWKSKGHSVGLRVLLETKDLVPDEDSRKDTWWESIAYEDSCAFPGRISPENILGIVDLDAESYTPLKRSPNGYKPLFSRRKWIDRWSVSRQLPCWYRNTSLKHDVIVV